MKLAPDEQEMLEGKQGKARQKAMELLTKFGDALGAEKFVNTDNVLVNAGLVNYTEAIPEPPIDMDAVASEYYLDSRERVIIDRVRAFTVNHIYAVDADKWELTNSPRKLLAYREAIIAFARRIGIKVSGSCTPYQWGNVPVFGEHCAWVESHAVAYINSVLGARANLEGLESAWSAAVTGKTLYWGRHLDENRFATLVVNVEADPVDVLDWGTMGYWVGAHAGLYTPVFVNVKKSPNMSMLMALSAAGATSGTIDMFHIVGMTPEAPTLERALGSKKAKGTIHYGKKERQEAYARLNSGKDLNVDVVSVGCPHLTLWQLGQIASQLEDKKVHQGTLLLIHTAKALKTIADRSGYTETIEKAGGHLIVDSCPLNIYRPDVDTIATDAVKAAHYLSVLQIPKTIKTWYGSTEDCILAAITGKWKGELK